METINDLLALQPVQGINPSAMTIMLLIGYIATQKLYLQDCFFLKDIPSGKAWAVLVTSALISIVYIVTDTLKWETTITTFAAANTFYSLFVKQFLNNQNSKKDE